MFLILCKCTSIHRWFFLRHGESECNLKEQFTGWEDSGMTPKGFEQARKAGRYLKDHGFQVWHGLYISIEQSHWIGWNYLRRFRQQRHTNGEGLATQCKTSWCTSRFDQGGSSGSLWKGESEYLERQLWHYARVCLDLTTIDILSTVRALEEINPCHKKSLLPLGIQWPNGFKQFKTSIPWVKINFCTLLYH